MSQLPNQHERNSHAIHSDYVSCINSNDGDMLAYAKQASSASSISFPGVTIEVQHIHVACLPEQANYNAIAFEITTEDTQRLLKFGSIDIGRGEKIITGNVAFEVDTSYFDRMHKAIDSLPPEALRKILPNKEAFGAVLPPHRTKYKWPPSSTEEQFQMYLDAEQFDALCKIMNSDHSVPLLIAGPFGTGKTRLLARSAYNIFYNRDCNSKILIVAHHQSSADSMVEHFDIYDRHLKVARVHKVQKENQRIKRGRKCIKDIPINELADYGHDLDKFDIIVTTLGTASSLLFKVRTQHRVGYFTHILIDEGAQTREPEAIIPLCFAGEHTKIVIAGDHCQVTYFSCIINKMLHYCNYL